MPKITIDDRELEVAPNTMVIEAAAQLGIMIPRFCYHPALGSVGACRVCAVQFVDGPLKGIQMSCMVKAQDGMVVSTTDEEAVQFRKSVIEWLMLHHPHDCPVCDEGGHCLLQDMTVSGGHGIRRYAGPKRTYNDQYLGPLIQHEMNRCIHCYRCSRFYQEFAGYRDLGAMGSANRTYFGRFEDGILESPFTGNLSDICPTGVYTDKPSRFFGRRWDYQRNPSLCINCSLGCQMVASARYREVRRQEARFSKAVNGYFICDRGRYGFFYASLKSRPRHASINGEKTSHDVAVQTAIEKLGKIGRDVGASAIAALGSVRSSLETQSMLRHLCQLSGWRNPAYFMDPAARSKVKTAITRLEDELAVSMREIEKADYIVCLGADPINEAPMLALSMRQAQINGAEIVVVDPRPVSLPLDYQHLAVTSDDLSGMVRVLIKTTVGRQAAASLGENAAKFYDTLPDRNQIAGYREDLFAAVVDGIKISQRPVIICGTDIPPLQTPGIAADFVLFLRAADKNAGLFYLLPGANAFGAGLLSDDKASMLSIIEAIEDGDIRALVLVESDPFFQFSDRKRLAQALDALDLLIVLDYINSDAVQKAHIFIPSTTIYEADGVFVNQEGRAQRIRQAHSGGVPIVQSGGGNHPPRIYGSGIPGAAPTPAWLTMVQISEGQTTPETKTPPETYYQWLADIVPELGEAHLTSDIPDEGLRLNSRAKTDLRFTTDFSGQPEDHQRKPENLQLVLTELTFGTEVLSGRSECLRELETEPAVIMHTGEAHRLNLTDGDSVSIQTESGKFEAKLKVVENMAVGVLVVPRHRKISWQIFEAGSSSIGRDQVKKVAVKP
jgi:NADH-quinone oxidoreductase subunit G